MNLVRSISRPLIVAAAATFIAGLAGASDLYVEVGGSRSRSDIMDLADAAVRQYARRTATLSEASRLFRIEHGLPQDVFTLPVRVILTENGVPLPLNPSGRGFGADIIPTFDTAGARAFPAEYRAWLESVFTAARPAMNAIFGMPDVGGVVHVLNYDADIQDRLAVAGGYYVPNGPDGPEIRFPVFFSPAATAVNYIHTMLLAYAGDKTYPFESYQEGFVRAAAMMVSRSAGSIPNPVTSEEVELTLESLYDVTVFYDWYNQPALGGPAFIAPNLLDTPLPPGGNTGGIFLLRYKMVGTTWLKVGVQYPGFFAEFNGRYYAAPAGYQTEPQLLQLGQDVLDFLTGQPGTTVEGLEFEPWTKRQYILDNTLTPGLKLLAEAFPIPPAVSGDFGVFGIVLNAFRTDKFGDETLLTGRSYPIFWRPDFVRFFTNAQDDLINVTAAWGSVVPNFPEATFGGEPYRVAVDLPFEGNNARLYLPAGAIATITDPTPKNFYGTLTGLPALSPGEYSVSVDWVGGSATDIPVLNFAFGTLISDTSYDKGQALIVRVFLDVGAGPVEAFTRKVNKSVGSIGLDLRPPTMEVSYQLNKLARLEMIGLPLQPYRIHPADLLQQSFGETLFARWNAVTNSFDLFPTEGQFLSGLGYFVRAGSAATVQVDGRTAPDVPVVVSLQPGWNMVSVPFQESISTSDLLVTVSSESVSTFIEAAGVSVGSTVFEFAPAGGNPDTGTILPVTVLQPGKSYFVRALRPEGAVLIFVPASHRSRSGVGGGSLRPLGLPEYWSYTPKRWETEIVLRDPLRSRSPIVIGQATNGLRAVRPSEDVTLPPNPAGMQLSIANGRRLYKDIRLWGSQDEFSILAEGLVPGRRYVLEFKPMMRRKSLTLIDLDADRTRRYIGRGRYMFIARAQTHKFIVRTGAGR
ncbi:MAG: hypothetical protein IH944_06560 [Armatimonadetes bacterium]|nr:hypothetical protein [Armatimonadota bacterium]